MRIVTPTCDYIPMPTDKESMLKHIERCGRVCYKSEDKITDGSAEKFIAGIIKRGHGAVLEHAAIILQIDQRAWDLIQAAIQEMEIDTDFRSYLSFTNDLLRPLVSGNIRAWRKFMSAYRRAYNCIPGFCSYLTTNYPELFPEFLNTTLNAIGLDSDVIELQTKDLITDNERLHHQYQTLLFTCDRGVTHELVRHRPSSFCQESTRYCNYSKDGFGGEIAVIDPVFFDPGTPVYHIWKRACEFAETAYFDLLNEGCSPQQARSVLPTSLKTELMMTANLSEWRHVVKLRCDVAAHPQAREVMNQALEWLHVHIDYIFDDQWEEFGYGV